MALRRSRHIELVDEYIKAEIDASPSDDENDNSEDRIETGWKLYEKIFSFLDTESSLAARQVCKRWNQVICKDSLLFSKIRVKVQNANPSYTSFTSSPPTLTPNPFSYCFNCPNFHFENYDFRIDSIQDFFAFRGHSIKHLKLTNCLVTLPTLQGIMTGCINVEHFEVIGVHRAVASCERIFPKPYQFRCFPNLKTLILKSAEPEINHRTQNRCNTSFSSCSNDCSNEINLLPGFLQDLIEYSEKLQSVHLLNWSGKTCSYFMNIINQRTRYKNFKEFHSSQMRPPITSIDLIPLCVRTAHVGLRKLTISPSSPFQHHEFGIMVIRGILRNYRLTLEELNVSNCPVSSAIFKSPMPKLNVLIAIGTNMSSAALFSTLTPKLENAVFQTTTETPKQTIERYLTRYNLKPPCIPPMALERYIANRLGFFRDHYLVNPENSINNNNNSQSISGNRKSVIREFHACSTFDFVNLVLFGMAFIMMFIFGLSAIFKTYSAILFISFASFIFVCEVFDIWNPKN